MLRVKNTIVVAFMIAFLSALTGCSALAPESQQLSAEQTAALEQRVRARWQTLIDKDFEKTWEFSTPAYRKIFPKNLFIRNFSYSVDWELTEVQVTNYYASAAVASVAVRVMSKPTKQTASSAIFGALPITIHEKWVTVDGEWWHSINEK